MKLSELICAMILFPFWVLSRDFRGANMWMSMYMLQVDRSKLWIRLCVFVIPCNVTSSLHLLRRRVPVLAELKVSESWNRLVSGARRSAQFRLTNSFILHATTLILQSQIQVHS